MLNCVVAYNDYGGFCVPLSSYFTSPSQKIIRGEQYEEDSLKYIRSRNLTGDIIHAGAYFGDTLPALSQATSGIVWTFEPNKENFKCAQITALINDLSNVKLFENALGSVQETRKLQTVSNGIVLGGTSRISEEGEDVAVKPLDDIIPRARKISLIFLDVERFEEEVLKGAQTILEQKPTIIVELNNPDIEKIMTSFGYHYVKGLDKRKWMEGFRNGVFEAR